MNITETRLAIASELPHGLDKYNVRSEWLVDIIIGIRDSGKYAYNSDIERIASSQLGELSAEEQKRLGTLVYNAQKYARESMLTRAGFVRATQERLAPLVGKRVKAVQNGSLSGELEVVIKRDAKGEYRMMLPRCRVRCLTTYADNWIHP